jgi:hypothetical protein
VLYLEAEEAGIRSTGIGCYFDDPVHEVFGIVTEAISLVWKVVSLDRKCRGVGMPERAILWIAGHFR